MTSPRELLIDYVRSGKLLQLATLREDGSPEVCNVWYDAHFEPDLVRFISRHDRQHSANIRARARVAGSIVAIPLDGLGQVVRGVTFTGTARQLPQDDMEAAARAFVGRWPAAASALDRQALADGTSPTRVYEVAVSEWVLFDELNLPSDPRQAMAASAAG